MGVVARRRCSVGGSCWSTTAAATTAELARGRGASGCAPIEGTSAASTTCRSPGTQDITADVALDQLFGAVGDPDAVRTQAQFLQRWGINELVDEGQRIWAEQAARPTDLAAMTMRSRVREAEALLDVTGLGAFTVIEVDVHVGVTQPIRG